MEKIKLYWFWSYWLFQKCQVEEAALTKKRQKLWLIMKWRNANKFRTAISNSFEEFENIRKHLKTYGTKIRPGRPPKLTASGYHQLLWQASKDKFTLQVSKINTILISLQVLNKPGNLVFQGRNKVVTLNDVHKKKFIELTKEQVTCTKEQWKKVMSFNEKFNSKMVSVESNAIGRRKKK